MKKSTISLTLLALSGFSAGIVGGLFGAGGGIIVVFALEKLFHDKLQDRRDVFANAMCVIFPLAITSLITYTLRSGIKTDGFGVYILPAALGGIVGSLLLGKLNIKILRRIFAAIIVFSGVMLMVR